MEKAESPVKTHTDEYGWEEVYERFFVEHFKTGHIWKQDECGTCDGACCRTCSDVWRVGELGVTERIPFIHVIRFQNFWGEEEMAAELYNTLCEKGEWPE